MRTSVVRKNGRKALCVGIDYYQGDGNLPGCTRDAEAIGKALSQNYDGSSNFDVTYLLAKDENSSCTSDKLFTAVRDLFEQAVDTVVFYYSGHGGISNGTGYLVPSNVEFLEDCLTMDTLLKLIQSSRATNKVIILDCCHAGALGKFSSLPGCDILPENTTILAASRANQTSGMDQYGSFFTVALYEALYGGAANILGEITPASTYSFVERALCNYRQRPLFKANLENFICLRKHTPSITLDHLKELGNIFYNAYYEFPLDPSYEEDKRDVTEEKFLEHNPEHEAVFALLREYAALNLVVPVGEKYMYQAAVNSKSCKLTPTGIFYWKLIKEKII